MLTRYQMKRLMLWGDDLSRREDFQWREADTKAYMALLLAVKQLEHEQYEKSKEARQDT